MSTNNIGRCSKRQDYKFTILNVGCITIFPYFISRQFWCHAFTRSWLPLCTATFLRKIKWRKLSPPFTADYYDNLLNNEQLRQGSRLLRLPLIFLFFAILWCSYGKSALRFFIWSHAHQYFFSDGMLCFFPTCIILARSPFPVVSLRIPTPTRTVLCPKTG